MTSAFHRATLHLTPPVHVAAGGEVVPVRRKGLAMLAYVALEGPTRRERLADVLWGHPRALRNLRVELHRLRAAFSPIGIDPIARVADPVVLDRAVEVAPLRRGVELLEGLEDVSSEYQVWLEYRRAVAETAPGAETRAGLLDALAHQVTPPFVLVLQGAPGSGRRTLARELARRLGLPFGEGSGGQGPRLRYLAADPLPAPDDDAWVQRIRDDRDGVWVIGRSAFGTDSPLLLRLRAEIDPERWRFERLGPLAWRDAQRILAPQIGFHAGARLYLAAGGNPGYLHELSKMCNGAVDPADLVVPQRLRAAIELETLRLSTGARESLARLSVHTGRLQPDLITALGASEHLDELECNGWLLYDGETWTLADPSIGGLLRSAIRNGQLLRLRQKIAQHLEIDGMSAVDAQPGSNGLDHDDPAGTVMPATSQTDGVRDASSIQVVRVAAAAERCLDDARIDGATVSVDFGRIVWSRLPPTSPPERVTWPLAHGRALVRVTGRAQSDLESDAAGTGSELFRMTVLGSEPREVAFLSPPIAVGRDLAPNPTGTGTRFDHAFLVEDGRAVQLACGASRAVVEVDVRRYDIADDDSGTRFDAIDLTAASDTRLAVVASIGPLSQGEGEPPS